MFGDLWPDVPDRRGADPLGHQRRPRPRPGCRPRWPTCSPATCCPSGTRPRPTAGSASTRPATTSCGGSAEQGRERLVAFVRQRLRAASCWPGACRPSDVAWTDEVLDPKALTIGFARRFATYKRATLLLSQPERLRALLLSTRPAGAVRLRRQGPPGRRQRQGADPPDRRSSPPTPRSATASCSSRTTTSPSPAPCYQGADVWLNNPRRPLEACGTSGMKAALNGGAQPARSSTAGGTSASTARTAGPSRRPRRVDDLERRDELEADSAVRAARAPDRAAVLRALARGRCPAGWVRAGQGARSRSLGPVRDRQPAWCATTSSSCTSRPARGADALSADGHAPGPRAGGVEGRGCSAGVARRPRRRRRAPTPTVAELGRRAHGRGRGGARRPRRRRRRGAAAARPGRPGRRARSTPTVVPMTPGRRRPTTATSATRARSPASGPAATASPCGSSPPTPTWPPRSSSACIAWA